MRFLASHTMNTGLRVRMTILAVLALTVAATVAWTITPVYAAGITVTTTTDELNSDGDCSLREAIQSANTDTAIDACAAGSGADTITLPAGMYTITLAGAGENANATGDFDITGNLTINGAGAATTIINANALDRALHSIGTATLTLQDLTVQNGLRSGGDAGGGIRAEAALTLTRTIIKANTVTGSTYGGGAIAYGQVVISNSTFTDNISNDRAPGLYAVNGATLTNTNFLNGSAPGGGHGGAAFLNGTVIINGGVFSNNRANWTGALVVNGTLAMSGTQFIGNSAITSYAGALQLNGSGTIVNALFARNHGSSTNGQIYIQSGTVNIIHTTIANATLDNDAAIYVDAGTVTTSDTIIVNHASGIQRIGGTVSENYNMFFGNTANIVGTVTSGGNSQVSSPGFLGLPCDDYKLMPNSPAINSGTDAGVTSDFEGDARPLLGGFDIGYDEVASASAEIPIACLTPTSSSPTVLGSTTTFASTIANGTNVTYQWDFGDGQTSTGAAPTHTYAAAGQYIATVTATNSLGNRVATTTVTVRPPPTIGSYPASTAQLSRNTTISPSAAPLNTTRIQVAVAPGFKGTLAADLTSGAIRVNNASPSGSYPVTVTAFNSSGDQSVQTFTLTVDTPQVCAYGKFSPATALTGLPTNPIGTAIGDFNADGNQDLAVASWGASSLSIYLGNGAGGFAAPTTLATGSRPWGVAVADFNGDGRQDLVVPNSLGSNVSVYIGNGAGGFAAPTSFAAGTSPYAVVVSDFNRDAKPDLAVGNLNSSNISILLGDGAGSFAAATTVALGTRPHNITVADFNGDGNPDLATANYDAATTSVLLGNGTGGFGGPTSFAAGTNPTILGIGDFNEDGRQDLAVSNAGSNNLSVLLGNGDGTFGTRTNYATAAAPFGAVVGDFNRDGHQDLVTASNSASVVSILLGTGTGSFGAATNVAVGNGSYPPSVGDFNADGKQDLAVANFNAASVSLLAGQCAPTISDTLDQTSNEDIAYGPISVTIGDAETPTSSLTMTGSSSNTTLVPNANIVFGGSGANRTVTITPAANQTGSATITLTVSDGVASSSDTFVFTVSPVNDAPVASTGSLTTNEDTTGSGTLFASDSDSASLTYRLVANGTKGVATITNPATGAYTYTPSANVNGTDSFTFMATDGTLGSLSFDGVDDSAFAALDGTGLTQLTIEMWLKPSAVDSKGIFQWAETPGSSNPFVYFLDQNGVFTLYVDSDYRLTTPLSMIAPTHIAVTYDGTTWRLYANGSLAGSYVGGQAYQSVAQTVTFGQGYQGFWNGMIDEPRIWNVARTQAQIATAMQQQLRGNETGLIAYYHFNESPGSATAANAVSGGPVATLANMDTLAAWSGLDATAFSNIATVNVTITAVNDAPSFTAGASQTVAADSGLQTISNWATALVRGPSDEIGQTLSFVVSNNNNALFATQPAIAANGTLTFTPAASMFGSATVTVRVRDNGGTANGGVDTSAPQTFTITVNNVAPTASFSNGGVVNEGSAGSVSFSAQSDPSSADTIAGFHYAYDFDNNGTFDLGNGSYAGSGTGATVAVPASYLTDGPGSRIVRGRIIDKNDGFTDYTTTISINNVVPTVTAPANQQASIGVSTLFALGSFSDPGADSPWQVTVDWGDGSANDVLNAATQGTISNFAHTYAAVNSYTVTVSVREDAGTGSTSSATFTVSIAIPPTITSPLPGSGQYGQSYSHTFTATGTPTPTFLVTTGSLPPGLSLSPAGLLSGTPTQAGTYSGIIVTASNGANPSATQMITIVIARASLAVNADSLARTYGAANPALSFTTAGLVNGDTAATTLTGALATSASPGSSVGSYPITQGTLTATSNYSVSFTAGTLTITQAALVVTANNQLRTYGAANPLLAVSYTGFVNGDTPGVIDTAPTATTTAISTSPVGFYTISASGGIDNNYSFSYIDGTLTVTAAPLTITAANQSRPYGAANPLLTVTGVGFMNGETISTALTGTLATTASPSSPVGNYPITQGTLAAANYTISFTAGTLNVTPATLTVTADDKARVYGVANPALSFTTAGLVNGDTVGTALTGALTTSANASSPVGSYPITQGTLAALNYAITFTPGTLTVGSAVLDVVANPQNRVYGVANPTLTYTVTGFTNGDTSSIMTGALATTASILSPVGSYAIGQGNLDAANYVINYTGASLVITPAPLAVTAADQARAYSITNGPLTFSTSGLVNGDTPATALTGSLATTATPSSSVGSYPITQGSLDAANYTITFTTGTLTITPVALVISATDQTRSYGAINPPLTFTASGLVNGDTVGTALTGALLTSGISASPVGSYPITQGTLAAANYTISFTAGTLTITPADLTVAADNKARVYGAANPLFTYTATGFVNGDTIATALTGALTTTATPSSPVGNYAISQGSLAAPNYAISFTDGTLTIGTAVLNVAADNQTRTYGAANPPLTYLVTGFINGDTSSILTGALTTNATVLSSVGNYAISQGTLAAPNYVISYTGASLSITPAALTITADSQSRTYGAANSPLTFTASGFINGDTVVSDLTGALATTATPSSNVGNYAINQGSISSTNYTISFTAGTLTVTPAALGIIANDQTRVYGASDPPLTVSATGLVNGDTVASALTGALTTSANGSSGVGSYPITQGTLVASNYSINFTAGTLTIGPATLSITADDKARAYGAANPALTFTTSGLVSGDTIGTALTGTLATTAIPSSPVGIYPITQGTLAAPNYTITFTNGILTIGSAVLNVVADNQTRLYGAVNPTLTYTVTGFASGDNASILTGALTTTAVTGSNVGSYAISQGTLAAPNYAINYTGASLSVTPVVLTATADNQSRIYGSANPTLTITYSGFVQGDTVNVLDVRPVATTTAISTSPVGSYPIIANGGSDNNYSLSYVAGTLSILPTGQTTCTSTALQSALNQPGPVINLDGACHYLITELSGVNGHVVNLYSKNNLLINGNGAIIERTSAAGDLGILALIDSTNVTIQNLTLIGGRANQSSAQLGGRGGGILLYNSTNITLLGLQFYGNSATIGGGLSSFGGSTQLYSSVLADNQAIANGAGFYAQGQATVINTTITSSTPNAKEALFAWHAMTIKNTILANHAVGLAAASGSNPVDEDYTLFSDVGQARKTYNTSTITGGAASFTVAHINQYFVNPAEHNYRLLVNSPAIDRGTIASATIDADGRTRPFGGTNVDLGAYEFQGDGALTIRKTGPHWVNAGATFTYEVTVVNNGLAALSNLQIRDPLPAAVSFAGGATGGGTFNGTTVRWDVANLAPGQILSLTYHASISQSVVNSGYMVVRKSDGIVLATGPALETLVSATSVLHLQNGKQQYFTPGVHDFSFANWRDSASGADLTTASMYTLYGPAVCAAGTGASASSCVLSATAQQQLQNLLDLNKNGRMFGMVAASLKLFLGEALADGHTTPADYQPGAAVAFDLLRYADLQHLIGLYQAGRSSLPQSPSGVPGLVTDGTPAGLVNFLLANGFSGSTNNSAYTLSVRKRDGSGALLLLPYALESKAPGIQWLYVYDASSPGDLTRVIVLDTTANTWRYTSAGQDVPGYDGDAASQSILLRNLAADVSMPRACDFCGASGTTSDQMTYAMNGAGRFLITNSAGQRIGYDPVSGTYINEIPGAVLDFVEADAGLDLPPIVRVPLDGSYTTALFRSPNGTSTTPVSLAVTAPGMITGLRNLALDDPSDLASMTIDYAHRTVEFQANAFASSGLALDLAIEQADGTSYRFELTGVDLPQGSGVALGFDPTTSQLTMSDTDTGRTQRYDLSVIRVQPMGIVDTFQRLDLTSGTGNGAVIDFGDWDGQIWPPTAVLPNLVYLPLVIR